MKGGKGEGGRGRCGEMRGRKVRGVVVVGEGVGGGGGGGGGKREERCVLSQYLRAGLKGVWITILSLLQPTSSPSAQWLSLTGAHASKHSTLAHQ